MAQSSLEPFVSGDEADMDVSSLPPASSPHDDDLERELDDEEKRKFWEAETELRKRTGLMTAKERFDLQWHPDCGEQRTRLLDYFCHQRQFPLWKKWLEDMIDDNDENEKPYVIQAGVFFPSDSRAWTICKGVMKTLRARQEPTVCYDCECLNVQYFQPAGCDCPEPKGPLLTWDNSICHKCSQCMRCWKYPVLVFGDGFDLDQCVVGLTESGLGAF